MSNRYSTHCINAGQIRALLAGTLSEDEQAELEAHLEVCEACRRAFDRAAAAVRFWDDLHRFVGLDSNTTRRVEDVDDDVEPLDFLEPDNTPGRIGWFGRYEVLDILGRGGMGIVLKAFDPGLHRVIAIKVLSPRLATSASARKRFLREARAAASVAHEHIVTIHAVDEANGLPYLVMHYVAGRSLQERIDRDGPLDLESILRIGMQTAAGLAAAHAQGLVHRDVKPANILLENGIERVKITDFGLARAVDDASLTQSGVIAGTPQYMAPEQARAETVDHRADLFSLGSVLYAMCTGRSPFRAETTVAVLKRVCEDTPRPVSEVNASIPEWLGAIITRLHAKDPSARIQSAAEVAECIGRHLARLQQPTMHTTSSPPFSSAELPAPALDLEFDSIPAAKCGSPRRAGWRLFGTAAAVVGLLACGLAVLAAAVVGLLACGFAMLRIPTGVDALPATEATASASVQIVSQPSGFAPWPSSPPPYGAASAKDRPAGEVGILRGHSNFVEGIATPGDGRFALTGGNDHTLRRWDMSTGRETLELEMHEAISDVAVSRDGRFAVFGALDSVVYFRDLESGAGIPLTGHARKVRAVAISRDGRFALSGSEEEELRYWDLAQGKELCQLKGHSKGMCGVAISPDGRLGLSGSVDGTARLWDLEKRDCLRVLVEGGAWVSAVAFMPDGKRALIGRQDGTLGLHDLKDGRELRRFAGHRAYIRNVQASGDGRLILSAGSGALRLWDAASGDEVYQLVGVGGGIACGMIMPGDRDVLFGCYDTTVRLWWLPDSVGKAKVK